MSKSNLNKEEREENAKRRLGSDHPVCCSCGHDNPLALELHHLEGQAHGETLAIICRNCHRELSDAQLDHPEDADGQDEFLAHVGHLLLGLADLFRMLAERFVEFGQELIARANASAEVS